MAVALYLEAADRCPGCGQPLSDTTRPDAARDYMTTEVECQACVVAAARAKDARGDGDRPGRIIHVHPKPVPGGA